MKKNLPFFKATLGLILFSAFSNFALAQNTLDNAGLTATTPSASTYSLRKMSSAYTGKAIQVRRSSDDTLLDIGFTANGDLDTAALKTFVGVNNGLVATWYDQSGNGRNLATTGQAQPAIINNGKIYRKNSKPTLFHDANDGLAYSGADYMTTLPLSVNVVAGSNSSSATFRRAVQGSANWLIGPYNNQHVWFASGFNHQIATPWSTTEVEVFTVIEPSANASTSWRKGVSQTSGNSKGTPSKIQTGVQGSNPEGLDGFISEIVGFNIELSTADRQNLEGNQLAYYSFQLPPKVFINANATGNGTGTSWANAFTDFQAGIDAAIAGDSVFVAKGEYQPANGGSFVMKEGVKIYGSFQGNESFLSQRTFFNTVADSTVLKGNNSAVFINENLTTASLLDGFVIRNGAGANTGFSVSGGGIYNKVNASPTLTNLIITKNTASLGLGGGIANWGNSNPVISKSIIIGNSAFEGGGIYNSSSSPVMTNLTITKNSGLHFAGGVYNSNSSPSLTNIIISGNTGGDFGGGVYNYFNSNPVLINVLFNGNSATNGGAVANSGQSNATFINATISGNKASTKAGAMYNDNANPIIKNTVMFGNTATTDDGVSNDNGSTPAISNSLIQGITTTNSGNVSAGTYTATDIFTNPTTGSSAPTTTGDYTLKLGSPAIDKGLKASIPSNITKDLIGNSRVLRAEVDLGAFEFSQPVKSFVNIAATGANNGKSWANAFTNFKLGIDAAFAGDSVFVAKGTYQPAVNYSFSMKDGVKIYGSFQGTELFLSQRVIATPADSSILKGNGFAVITNSGISNTAVLDGFTITNGSALGGIHNDNSSPILSNLTIVGNTSVFRGGGVSNENSSPLLINVSIKGNKGSTGGGIYNSGSSPTLTNVVISGNEATQNGGGAYVNGTVNIKLNNVVISGNKSNGDGGGIYLRFANANLTNTTITGNQAVSGGAIYLDDTDLDIKNTIIFGNEATDSGNGIKVDFASSSSPKFYNSLIQESNSTANGNVDATGVSYAAIFTNPIAGSNAPTKTGDYTLKKGSPAINKGNNAYVPTGITKDLAGLNRINDTTVDLGAFEYYKSNIYVNVGAIGLGNGTSWANAFTGFQAGVNAAVAGDSVFVAKGTYQAALGLPFTMKEGVKIYGGFQGTETMLSKRVLPSASNGSILSGSNSYVIYGGNGTTAVSILDGFTITGGNRNGSGGGIINQDGSPAYSNLNITGNYAVDNGGGVYNQSCSPTFTNVNIYGNVASNGGGMYNALAKSTLLNVTIAGNFASVQGGGLANVLIFGPTIKNSIIFGNTATNDSGIYNDAGAIPKISYSLVQDSTSTSNGNISAGTYTAAAIFTNPVTPSGTPTTSGDYTLKTGSPAINMGDNTGIPSNATDLAGNPRIFEMTIDLGAYENQGAVVLPVELVSFSAKAEVNSALLKWQTVSESNNKKFIISHSVSGTNFKEIGTVASLGDSYKQNAYSFTDFNPAKGVNYYRLSQQDLNGTIKVMGIKAIDFGLDQEVLSVYPNPAENEINIKFGANTYQNMFIINLNGQVLQSAEISSGQSILTQNVATLSAGSYIILLKGNDTQSQIRFIKK